MAIDGMPNISSLDQLSLEGVDIPDLINSGDLDLDSLLEGEEIPLPSSTITTPAITPNEQPAVEKEGEAPQPQSPQDTERLKQIEDMLMQLDERLKLINTEDEKSNDSNIPQNEQYYERKNIIDSLLESDNKTEGEGPRIEVLNNPKVLNSKEFNKETIERLTQQQNTLLAEREKILRTQIDNFSTNNEYKAGDIENITQEGDSIINNNENTSVVDGGTNNSFLNTDENISLSESLNNTQNFNEQNFSINPQSSSSVTNNEQNIMGGDNFNYNYQNSQNNIDNITNVNQSLEGVQQPNVTNENNAETVNNFSNVVNNNETLPQEEVDQIETKTPEDFFSQTEDEKKELPNAGDTDTQNSAKMISLLEELKQEFGKLGETIGGRFADLNKSMDGIKTNVINNSYNTGGGQGATTDSNNTAMRETMNDYRLDHAHPSDVPAGVVDVAKMQGTNLPNPQFIL